MTPLSALQVVTEQEMTIAQLNKITLDDRYRGYPIVTVEHDPILCGYILTSDLRQALSRLVITLLMMGLADAFVAAVHHRGSIVGSAKCTFARGCQESSTDVIDLSAWANDTPMTMSVNSASEVIVQLFQRLVSPFGGSRLN